MRLRSVIFAAVVDTMVAGQLADLPRWQLAQQLAFGQTLSDWPRLVLHGRAGAAR
jgi:hypothetical protein